MRNRIFLLLLGISLPVTLVGVAGAGCGSVSIETNPDELDGGGGDAKHDAHTTVTTGDPDGMVPIDALPDYVDPGCPDAGPPITQYMCDPFNQKNGDCMPGEGCFIFVQYPQEPCGQEIYGAGCAPVGPGGQGDPCMGFQDCGGGFVCVVSGSGNQCIQLCPLTGKDGCAPGLSCEPIDVEGFGGCL
jgi:hypothetical protein